MVMCCQAAILLHSLCSIIFLFLPPSRPLSKCVCVKVVFSTATPPVSNRFLCFSMCLCRLVQCAYCIWKVAKNAWIYGFLDLLVLGISPLPLPSARSQNALNVHNKQIWLLWSHQLYPPTHNDGDHDNDNMNGMRILSRNSCSPSNNSCVFVCDGMCACISVSLKNRFKTEKSPSSILNNNSNGRPMVCVLRIG